MISGVKALPRVSPIKTLAGGENVFGLKIGKFSNLIAMEVTKIAPKSQGIGICIYIKSIAPKKPMKSASNILNICCTFIIDFLV